MALVKATSRYRWVILAVTILCQVANNGVTQVVGPLAPLIQADLGLSKAEVGVFSSGLFFGAWAVLLVAGSLTDRLGVRKMMSLGQITAGGFVLLMATAGSFLHGLLVLTVASLGRGAVNPPASKAIIDWFPARERATAMGLKQTGYPMGGILSAAILPAVALALGWRAAFVVAGLFLVTSGIISGVLYRDAGVGGQTGGRSPRIGWQMGHVLRNRRLWALSGTVLLFITVQISLLTYLALYLNDIVLAPTVPDGRARLVAAGGFLALCQAGGVVGRVFWGLVSDRFLHGRRMAVIAGIGLLTILLLLLLAHLDPGPPAWALTAIVLALGLTAVAFNGLTQTAAVECAGVRYAGTATGFTMTVSQLGTVGGPPLFGFLVDVSGSYRTAWLFIVCLAAIGTVVAGTMARKEKGIA